MRTAFLPLPVLCVLLSCAFVMQFAMLPSAFIECNHLLTTLHYTTLHYTTLHYTTLHYTTLHYTTLLLTHSPSLITTLHYSPPPRSPWKWQSG